MATEILQNSKLNSKVYFFKWHCFSNVIQKRLPFHGPLNFKLYSCLYSRKHILCPCQRNGLKRTTEAAILLLYSYIACLKSTIIYLRGFNSNSCVSHWRGVTQLHMRKPQKKDVPELFYFFVSLPARIDYTIIHTYIQSKFTKCNFIACSCKLCFAHKKSLIGNNTSNP